jgi:hypothetical protein
MPATNFNLSVARAFNVQDDPKGALGHVTSLRIGTAAADKLATDITLTNPLGGSNVAVVGPLATIFWGGGAEDPIGFELNISTANKLQAEQIVQQPLGGSVQFSFVVYGYDLVAKEFFVAFRGAADGSALTGVLSKMPDESHAITLGPVDPVQNPSIPWELSLVLNPQDSTLQHITVAAASSSGAVSTVWGTISYQAPGNTGVSTGFGGPGSDR